MFFRTNSAIVRSDPSLPCQFCSAQESRNHRLIPNRNLDVLHSNFSRTAQNSVRTRESSCRRSALAAFIAALKVSNATVKKSTLHWLFDEIFRLLLHLDQRFMEMSSLHLLCPSSSSPIQTRLGLLFALRKNFPKKVDLRNCHRFVPNLMRANRTPVITPAITKPRIVSVIRLCKFQCF